MGISTFCKVENGTLTCNPFECYKEKAKHPSTHKSTTWRILLAISGALKKKIKPFYPRAQLGIGSEFVSLFKFAALYWKKKEIRYFFYLNLKYESCGHHQQQQ